MGKVARWDLSKDRAKLRKELRLNDSSISDELPVGRKRRPGAHQRRYDAAVPLLCS